jgi:hypothetical protein
VSRSIDELAWGPCGPLAFGSYFGLDGVLLLGVVDASLVSSRSEPVLTRSTWIEAENRFWGGNGIRWISMSGIGIDGS